MLSNDYFRLIPMNGLVALAFLIVLAVLLREKQKGDLAYVQIGLALGALLLNTFKMLPTLAVVLGVLTVPAYFMGSEQGTVSLFWFFTGLLSAHTGDLKYILVLATSFYWSHLVGTVFGEEDARRIICTLPMLLSAVFINTVTDNFKDVSKESILTVILSTIAIVKVAISSLEKPYESLDPNLTNGKQQESMPEERWRLIAGVMLPFTMASMISLLMLRVTDQTWRQIGEGLGKYGYNVVMSSASVLIGYIAI